MQPRTHVVIHHSATKDSATVSWGAIRRYHTDPIEKKGRGWNDIGYHFGIELIDTQYETLLGRRPDQAGAHCKEMGMNGAAFGICIVGNFDIVDPPEEALRKAVQLIRWLQSWNPIKRENIIGHREAGLQAGFNWEKGQYKSCPGSLFNLNAFRALV